MSGSLIWRASKRLGVSSDLRHSRIVDHQTVHNGLTHIEVRKIVHGDECGSVPRLHKSGACPVVQYGIDSRRFQHVPDGNPQCDSAPDHSVNVSFHKIIRMIVVRAEHRHVRRFGNNRGESIEISGGTSLADDYLHPESDALACLFQCGTFVVSGDSGRYVFLKVFPSQTGAWPSTGFPASLAAAILPITSVSRPMTPG